VTTASNFTNTVMTVNTSLSDATYSVVYLWNAALNNFSFLGEFFGSDDIDKAGFSVGVGDFNNDGFADFVLGGDGAEGGCLNASSTTSCGSGVVYLWNTSTSNFSFFGELMVMVLVVRLVWVILIMIRLWILFWVLILLMVVV